MSEDLSKIVLQKPVEIGIPLIETQHSNLIRILNNLRLSCLKGTEISSDRFKMAVHEAIEFAYRHFGTEERLMNLLAFPGLSGHKKEHEDFIMHISGRIKQFKQVHDEETNNDANAYIDELLCYVCRWTLLHMDGPDREFTDFVVTTNNHCKLQLILSGNTLAATNIA